MLVGCYNVITMSDVSGETVNTSTSNIAVYYNIVFVVVVLPLLLFPCLSPWWWWWLCCCDVGDGVARFELLYS